MPPSPSQASCVAGRLHTTQPRDGSSLRFILWRHEGNERVRAGDISLSRCEGRYRVHVPATRNDHARGRTYAHTHIRTRICNRISCRGANRLSSASQWPTHFTPNAKPSASRVSRTCWTSESNPQVLNTTGGNKDRPIQCPEFSAEGIVDQNQTRCQENT